MYIGIKGLSIQDFLFRYYIPIKRKPTIALQVFVLGFIYTVNHSNNKSVTKKLEHAPNRNV